MAEPSWLWCPIRLTFRPLNTFSDLYGPLYQASLTNSVGLQIELSLPTTELTIFLFTRCR